MPPSSPCPFGAHRTGPFPRLRHPHRVEKRNADLDAPEGAVPIARITPRRQAKVAGRVRSIQVQRWSRIPTLELTIIDTAGDTLMVVFLGRRQIAGIQPGTDVSVEAMVASRSGGLSMLNPIYEILPDRTYRRVRDHLRGTPHTADEHPHRPRRHQDVPPGSPRQGSKPVTLPA